MEFQVINRNRNAVIPEGMFKLCGMEDAKLISMVQLNGGILLMPESVSTYQLLMLIDALNEQACEFLEAVAIECGPAEEEHRGIVFIVCVHPEGGRFFHGQTALPVRKEA